MTSCISNIHMRRAVRGLSQVHDATFKWNMQSFSAALPGRQVATAEQPEFAAAFERGRSPCPAYTCTCEIAWPRAPVSTRQGHSQPARSRAVRRPQTIARSFVPRARSAGPPSLSAFARLLGLEDDAAERTAWSGRATLRASRPFEFGMGHLAHARGGAVRDRTR